MKKYYQVETVSGYDKFFKEFIEIDVKHPTPQYDRATKAPGGCILKVSAYPNNEPKKVEVK